MSEVQEEKKGWSWLGFLFAPYYYAGYGKLKKGVIYVVLGTFPLFGIIIAILGGRNARKDLPIGKEEFNWKNIGIIFVINIVTAMSLQMALENRSSSNKEIEIVKQSSLEMCPNATVEQMVDGYISNPSWESDVSDDGVKFVNISGEITYLNKTVDALLQFTFTKDGTSFKYNYFEMNEMVQNDFLANALLSNMCESTK